MGIFDLIDKLGETENSLTKREFISPFYNSPTVVTRVGGILYSFNIRGKRDPGWYRFKPVDNKIARFLGEAEYPDVMEYLQALPKIRLILIMKQKGVYLGLPIKNNKYGLDFKRALPVLLTDDIPLDFDMVLARYDGCNIWYESIEPINDPSKAQYLRECLEGLKHADKVRFSGLTIEEKAAYTIRVSLDKNFIEKKKKSSLQKEVEFAGGKFVSFIEKKDHFSIVFEVDGESYTTLISKNSDHQVISAGVCLSGGDRDFDLTSLVSVLREGQERSLIHRWS